MSKTSVTEIKNLAFFLVRNPVYGVKILPAAFIEKMVRFYRNRVKSKSNICPDYLKSFKRIIPDCNFDKNRGRDLDFKYSLKEDSVKIAGRTYSFEGRIKWDHYFEDYEDSASLHRWNWLLTRLTENHDDPDLADWGRFHIYDWIDQHIDGPRDPVIWGAYTTGERICNLLIFLEVLGIKHDPYMRYALCIMASHVFHNLEYFGREDTFNHVINNARALYFAGQYLGIGTYSEAARKILKNELPKLITDDGFLREGSSHYQFLFTRWILEILYVARRFQDSAVLSLVSGHAVNLIKRCRFFLVFNESKSRWEFPLFGDISPDFSPDWLITLPWSDLALSLYNPGDEANLPERSGWALLFRDNNSAEHKPQGNKDKQPGAVQTYSSGGWYRFDYRETTLFLHAEPDGITRYPGHFHSDSASFSLYRAGSPVIMDTGRMHYMKDAIGKYGLSAAAHNTVRVDGLDPFPNRRYFRLLQSVCGKPAVSWSNEGDYICIEISLKGFQRVHNDSIVFKRVFELHSSFLSIEDSFTGSANHLVENFFHFAPGFEIDLKDKNIRLTGNNGEYSVELQTADNAITSTKIYYDNQVLPAGLHFPEYGEKVPINTLIYKTETEFPFEQRFTFGWS